MEHIKNKIGVIVSTRQVLDLSKEVVAALHLADKTQIIQAAKDESLEIARQMEKEAYEVIVARGGTAELLMGEISTPVVMIPVSSQEIIQAIFDAKRISGLSRPRIALFSFTGMNVDADLFARILGVDLRVYPTEGTGDTVPIAMAKAREWNPDVLVGGLKSVKLAQELGLKSVFLTSGQESIKSALTEASKVVYAIKLEQARSKRMKILVNYVQEGIIYMDARGRIQLANPAAQRMLGRSWAQLMDQPVGRVMNMPNVDLLKCLRGEAELTEEVVQVGDSTLLVSLYPVGTEAPEAMISIQESRKISRMDARIRDSLYAKGLTANYNFQDILGESQALKETKLLATEFATLDSNILILGETGCGKELFAQSIHNDGPGAKGPFVAVNCAALPPSLLESELFGYEEGAFTGANRKGKPGLIELSHGGTLFLDEISEMDQYGQIRLLRFIQERQVMRLGGGRYLSVRSRVIAASNKNLRRLVAEGVFREDLYYRLKVLCLHVPPLRQRPGDIPLLIEVLTQRRKRLTGRQISYSSEALKLLYKYDWPGNVRELVNVLEFLAAASRGRPISNSLVREACSDGDLYEKSFSSPSTPPDLDLKSNSELERVKSALDAADGNHSRAALNLGIHRSTLFRKIKKYGLGPINQQFSK